MPNVMMLSFWRNDTGKRLRERAEHLLAKTGDGLRWVWVVGDCDPQDRTFVTLWNLTYCHQGKDIQIVPIDTGPHPDRYVRLSLSASAGLEYVRPDDDYVLIHESDIVSPPDVVERLLAHAAEGRCPVAGWPILRIDVNTVLFYDIWAYRKDGQLFTNYPPFHTCYRPDRPFEVDSIGTVWLMPAQDIREGVRCHERGCLELSRKFRERGHRIWVDPTLVVEQPRDLWVPHLVIP